MEITWLGHSALALEVASGETVLIDPFFEGNPSYPARHQVERCNAILLTHGHGDHLGNTVALAKQFAAKVVGIYELATWLAGQGVAETVGMNKGGTLDLGFLRATMTNAHHSSSGPDNVYLGEAAGFVIEADGRRVYFAGDTCVFGDMRLIAEIHGPLDMAVLPIGDLYTMGPKEASHACRLLRPKAVLPIHWGTFPALTGTPQALAGLIADLPGTKLVSLSPGETISV
jgi:L-ascorbate metabolism protein UlaG (beta-lactamase superfamily)